MERLLESVSEDFTPWGEVSVWALVFLLPLACSWHPNILAEVAGESVRGGGLLRMTHLPSVWQLYRTTSAADLRFNIREFNLWICFFFLPLWKVLQSRVKLIFYSYWVTLIKNCFLQTTWLRKQWNFMTVAGSHLFVGHGCTQAGFQWWRLPHFTIWNKKHRQYNLLYIQSQPWDSIFRCC